MALSCRGCNQQPRHGGFEGHCVQSAAGLVLRAPGHAGGACRVMLCSVQLPCPGELPPDKGMFAHSFSVAFHLPPIQLHKALFLRFSPPPKARSLWGYSGTNSHWQPSSSLTGRGKREQSCIALFEASGLPGRKADTKVSTLLGTWAGISQG